jgi:beta-galactosidase
MKQEFITGWKVARGTNAVFGAIMGEKKVETKDIILPYDAMIHEERTPDAEGGNQTGFYPGGIYTFSKLFSVPSEWKDKTVTFEFEGVYGLTTVLINGQFAGRNDYGYSGFFIKADNYLHYGEDNEISVIVNNRGKNSRWYSGSGIYRYVYLHIRDRLHIADKGVKILTPTVEQHVAVAEVSVKVINESQYKQKAKLKIDLIDDNDKIVSSEMSGLTIFSMCETEVTRRLTVKEPLLWDDESPNLYTCKVSLYLQEDETDRNEIRFGFRALSLDAVNGLRINGKQIKLRGTCIHHDNGILGAATLRKAEERRCRILKDAGFNCIRSSHNPMSPEMLEACDKFGMYVMDEVSDIWDLQKNPDDFGLEFDRSWKSLIKEITDKDYNHPSVILYCIGNEIPEVGTDNGADISRKLVAEFKKNDRSRFVTNAINGLLAAGDQLPIIIKDIMQDQAKETGGNNGDAMNDLMGTMETMAGDKFASHEILTEKMEECTSALDITGYNYLTARHISDRKIYPNRCILGTETYPADIARLWGIVRDNSYVLGDMTWTGYDYLGEAGCGIFHYDGSVNFSSHWPDRLAYIGDIDIIGNRRPVSYLREIIFGLRKEPYIAVERADRYGQKYTKTPWMLNDTVCSWTWPGFEGKKVKIDVYSAEETVELFVNGKSYGKKAAGEKNGYTAKYEIQYEPGIMEAVSCSSDSKRSMRISTAGKTEELVASLEGSTVNLEKDDVVFISIFLADKDGNINMFEKKTVRIDVDGEGYLVGFGSADPQATNRYDNNECETYDGRLLAAIRSNGKNGLIKVKITCNSLEAKIITINA